MEHGFQYFDMGSIGLEKDSKCVNGYNEWTDDWIKKHKIAYCSKHLQSNKWWV